MDSTQTNNQQTATSYNQSPWILCPRPNEEATLRLFCFSHAGAGASMFSRWGSQISPAIEVCAVQRPGRENRLQEAPYRDLTTLVQEMHASLQPYLDKPFICFGHSVGALICFEWARHLRRTGNPLPQHIFVSGRQAPQVPISPPWTHTFSNSELISELRQYGGTPEAVLQSAEFMALYLPILRADLAIHETYAYYPEAPLPLPVSAFGGQQDPQVSAANIQAWSEQTMHEMKLRLLPGGHLFVKDETAEILRAIAQDSATQFPTVS